jgi:hypothetical protein
MHAVRLERMLLCIAGLLVILFGTAHAAEPLPREYQVKAAYLYKLADYVDWPASTFDAPTSPLTICVVGADPFGPALDTATEGERAAGHSIIIKRCSAPEAAATCQVAYITAAKETASTQQLALFVGKPVLTVTDGGGSSAHGIIDFVIRDDRVRFDIDTRLAAEGGLSISSKLLSLAGTVRTR